MADRIKITSPRVSPFEDNLYLVMCDDAAGREYTLADPKGFPLLPLPFDRAIALVANVRALGTIDPDLWECRVPYGSDAWLLDGMEVTLYDDEERARFGL